MATKITKGTHNLKTKATSVKELDSIIERLTSEYQSAGTKEERKEVLQTLRYFKKERSLLACKNKNNSKELDNIIERLVSEYQSAVTKEEKREILQTLRYFKKERNFLTYTEGSDSVNANDIAYANDQLMSA